MGKPIAGQNQFPYAVGGFLVDGAKINGVTYAKKLYIYKQRSYGVYDLQDTMGNIYRFIRLGYQDTDGNMLNYFDVAEELVETIPDNTFFLKIQDPARDIFSFVRIYQWHKCITVEGDYVFRTQDIDPRLSGVLINPAVSTIQVGNVLSYKSLFYPSNYPNLDGSWYMNSLDGLRDNRSAEIVSTNLNTSVVKGMTLGKAVLTFVPKNNDALVTHSIINVIEDQAPMEEFTVKSKTPYTCYKTGDEFTLEVVTYPYDAVLTEALDFTITEGWNNETTTTLVSVSDDFKSYTFKSVLSPYEPEVEEGEEAPPDVRDSNVSIEFKMSSPIEYSYVYDEIHIASEISYGYYYDQPGYQYYRPRGLRPNMTWQCEAEISGPNQKVYPYVSSDPEIATFDYETGILTTHGKTGKVTFTTQYDDVNGSGVQDGRAYSMDLTVREDMYDYIKCEPQQVDTIEPGQSIKVTFTGYREGYDPVIINARAVNDKSYTVTTDGTLTASPTAVTGRTYVSPDVTLDYQVIATYNSTGIQPTINKPDNLNPMTSIMSNYYTYYVRYNEDPNIKNWETIMAYNRPNGSTSYQMKFDSYDESVIEVIDKDKVINTQCFAMGGGLYFYIQGLKRGSTEMVLSSVSNPDIVIKYKIVVY